MSDREDDDDESNEEEVDEEEEEDEEEHEEEEEDEEEGMSPEQKANAVQEDIDCLFDIFKYIDQTSRRISERLRIEEELAKVETNRNREMQVLGGESRRGAPSAAGPPVSWNQYESLNDAERATLLERALTALATDDNAATYDRGNSKPSYYSYNR